MRPGLLAAVLLCVLPASGCHLFQPPGVSLAEQMEGRWYLRTPPTFAANPDARMIFRDGSIAYARNGIVWGAYSILDERTIKLTHATERNPRVERLMTVRIDENGNSMGWFPTAETQQPVAFILSRNADDWTYNRKEWQR